MVMKSISRYITFKKPVSSKHLWNSIRTILLYLQSSYSKESLERYALPETESLWYMGQSRHVFSEHYYK